MRPTDFVARFGHQHPDLNDDPRPDPFLEADLALSRRVAEVIERHYFGHPFKVVVRHDQGIVQIQIPKLMPATRWFVVYIADLNADPGMKAIVRGCGDILERYNLPRCAYDREQFIAALQSVPIITRISGHGRIPS
jgi:hypothetical protein